VIGSKSLNRLEGLSKSSISNTECNSRIQRRWRAEEGTHMQSTTTKKVIPAGRYHLELFAEHGAVNNREDFPFFLIY
jgi:hypothetical protein